MFKAQSDTRALRSRAGPDSGAVMQD